MSLEDYFRPYTLLRKDRSDQFAVEPQLKASGAFTGLLQPVSGNEVFDHFKSDEKVTHRLYTGLTVPIVAGDVVEYSGQQYTVIYSFQPDGISGVNRHKEVLVGRYGERAGEI